ncbi:hypothetical protein ETD83_10255 [Actinomadura soli]|uniref:Uncharacterized protein n=1 Tax=Actinomadura soli TaxID=2508997 RepID=A0A5C4JFY2_9ACTN|nr:hypothetical protein [Actinomadura soli]TMR03697.1 hypothetical protein ETD83_10255 [Actinomadura soli]
MSAAGIYEVGVLLGGAVVLAAGGTVLAARAAGALTAATGGVMASLGERLEAAQAEWERQHECRSEWEHAALRVLDRNARIAVLAAECAAVTSGECPLSLPAPMPLACEIDDLAAWCASADAAIAEVESWLTDAAAIEIGRHLAEAWQVVRPGEPRPEIFSAEKVAEAMRAASRPGTRLTAARDPESLSADVARIVARLPADVAAEDLAAVRRAAGKALVRDLGEARTRLADLRQRVDAADTRAAIRRSDALDAAVMLQALADATDQDGLELKQALTDVVARRRDLDPALRTRTLSRCAQIQAAAEQEYLRQAVLTAADDLGFEVSADVTTLTGGNGRLELSRDDWPEHAVALVLDDGELRSMVFRTEHRDGQDARRVDREREQDWCDSFEEVRERLAVNGVQVGTRMELRPGERDRVPVTKAAAPARSRPRPKAREREMPQ